MKKVTTVCLSTFILGSLGMTSQTFAEDGGSYTSNGIVEFTPSEEPTNPVDPTDPTNPVDPDRKSTRLNSSHSAKSRMPSSA